MSKPKDEGGNKSGDTVGGAKNDYITSITGTAIENNPKTACDAKPSSSSDNHIVSPTNPLGIKPTVHGNDENGNESGDIIPGAKNANEDNITSITDTTVETNHKTNCDAKPASSSGNHVGSPTNPFCFPCLVLWPLISVVLGIVCGCILSATITSIVFLLTLVRTPMHIAKMLYVTATTNDCFRGYLSFSRLAVLLCVPVAHVLFLAGVTVFSATVGTLYYIGIATKIFYKHEYTKTAKKIESNARLEPKSNLGKYIKKCQQFMEDDARSYPIIYFLKGLIAVLPGALVAALVVAPFTIALVAITLYRLPINVYKTGKIAMFTVVLKWDLRLVVLALLPLIHVVFPLLIFFMAFLYSLFWTWARVSENVFEGKHPFDGMRELLEVIDKYYKEHEEFVAVRCHRFDHSSGIPDGWDGTTYGIDIARMLRWQRDFLISCLLVVAGIPSCVIATTLISLVKYVPCCVYWWRKYCKHLCCDSDSSCVTVLGCWPFHILVIVLSPAGILLYAVLLGILAVVRVLFQVPWFYLKEDGGFWEACRVQLEIIGDHDELFHAGSWWRVFIEDWELAWRSGGGGRRSLEPQSHRQRPPVESYWDRFVSQCIRTAAALLDRGYIAIDDVQGLEPSVIQSIPAVAVLSVLIDSLKDKELDEGDIKWDFDGTVCKDANRPVDDAIVGCLWPLVRDIKRLLRLNEKKILVDGNIELLQAMLCANTETQPDMIKKILDEAKPDQCVLSNRIRTKINKLVLAILRVRPYQVRMGAIYSHAYNEYEDIEEGIGPMVEGTEDGAS